MKIEQTSLESEKMITATELARLTGHSRQWVYNSMRRGSITGYRLPNLRKMFFKLSEIKFEKITFKYQQFNNNDK